MMDSFNHLFISWYNNFVINCEKWLNSKYLSFIFRVLFWSSTSRQSQHCHYKSRNLLDLYGSFFYSSEITFYRESLTTLYIMNLKHNHAPFVNQWYFFGDLLLVKTQDEKHGFMSSTTKKITIHQFSILICFMVLN